ncbi:hypothetical protein CASFOL_015902 [Castilleja foliolosa]|uniref:Uncharacterized protein n=1 Tax=Castilleja foliolosa TaxID=1961234 RepID=A0ABD3DGH6_9LAMI
MANFRELRLLELETKMICPHCSEKEFSLTQSARVHEEAFRSLPQTKRGGSKSY